MTAVRPPLVRRAFTTEGSSGLNLVEWAERSVRITEPGGGVAFACEDVEAPVGWSNLAVAVVAGRYFASEPGGARERSVRTLVERVVGAIAAWARAHGQLAGDVEREALFDELAALVLTQRATFATPVWLNAGLAECPFTSACFILKAEDSIPDLLDWNRCEGLIFQQGGGAGINLSQVRSSHEPVSRGGLASGPVSFMRATDAWAATIRSGGRARFARRWSCSTPRTPTSSSSSTPRRARRTEAGRCWPPATRSIKWSSRWRSSTPTTRSA